MSVLYHREVGRDEADDLLVRVGVSGDDQAPTGLQRCAVEVGHDATSGAAQLDARGEVDVADEVTVTDVPGTATGRDPRHGQRCRHDPRSERCAEGRVDDDLRAEERSVERVEYLYRYETHLALQPLERAMIELGAIRATGVRYVGRARE